MHGHGGDRHGDRDDEPPIVECCWRFNEGRRGAHEWENPYHSSMDVIARFDYGKAQRNAESVGDVHCLLLDAFSTWTTVKGTGRFLIDEYTRVVGS
jgi:hypothetical protein